MNRAWPIAVICTLLSGLAVAAPIDVQVVPTVIQGQGKPAVIVIAHQTVVHLRLQLARTGCGGEAHVDLGWPKLGGGQEHRFELDQPVGRCDYQGTLAVTFGAEAQGGELPLQFSTEVAGSPAVVALPQALDPTAHTVRVTFNREADHGAVELFGEEGKKLGESLDQPLGDAKPGEPLSLSYEEALGGKPVMRLRVTITDPGGLFGAVDLFPWSLSIPHQEVTFASGSAEIAATERPKLEDSLKQIRAALTKVGNVPVRLFVVGYTDTVGPSDSNQQLSAARARGIASFFQRGGLKLAILTAGLGEDALAVPTPDETDEPRNRRAEYILSVEPPPITGASRAPAFAPLP